MFPICAGHVGVAGSDVQGILRRLQKNREKTKLNMQSKLFRFLLAGKQRVFCMTSRTHFEFYIESVLGRGFRVIFIADIGLGAVVSTVDNVHK